jgi:hypothetical protein
MAVLPEEGSLPRAEKPTYPKGQTGKGVRVGGGHKKNPSSPLKIDDPYAHKLRGIWRKATSAATKFRSKIG